MTISTKTANALAQALGPEGISEAAELIAGLNNTSVVNGLTALAGGGQAGATALIAGGNRFTTVANDGDSCVLPVSVAGMTVVTFNSGAAKLDVFPAGAEVLNALAASKAVRQDVNSAIVWKCVVAGLWISEAIIPRVISKFTLNASAGATVAAKGDLTGATDVYAQYSGINGSTLTTRTATQMFADAGNVQPGDTYNLRIINSAGGNCTLTAADGSVTLTGHVIIATNTFVDYVVTFTTAIACVFQSVGSGVSP